MPVIIIIIPWYLYSIAMSCARSWCVCRIVYLNVFVYEICSNMNLLPSMAVQCTVYGVRRSNATYWLAVRYAQIWVSLIHSTVHCTASALANVEQRGAHKRKQLSQLIIIIIIYIYTTCIHMQTQKHRHRHRKAQAGTYIPPINRPRMAKLKWGNINLNRIFSVCKIFRRWLIFVFIFLFFSFFPHAT